MERVGPYPILLNPVKGFCGAPDPGAGRMSVLALRAVKPKPEDGVLQEALITI